MAITSKEKQAGSSSRPSFSAQTSIKAFFGPPSTLKIQGAHPNASHKDSRVDSNVQPSSSTREREEPKGRDFIDLTLEDPPKPKSQKRPRQDSRGETTGLKRRHAIQTSDSIEGKNLPESTTAESQPVPSPPNLRYVDTNAPRSRTWRTKDAEPWPRSGGSVNGAGFSEKNARRSSDEDVVPDSQPPYEAMMPPPVSTSKGPGWAIPVAASSTLLTSLPSDDDEIIPSSQTQLLSPARTMSHEGLQYAYPQPPFLGSSPRRCPGATGVVSSPERLSNKDNQQSPARGVESPQRKRPRLSDASYIAPGVITPSRGTASTIISPFKANDHDESQYSVLSLGDSFAPLPESLFERLVREEADDSQ